MKELREGLAELLLLTDDLRVRRGGRRHVLEDGGDLADAAVHHLLEVRLAPEQMSLHSRSMCARRYGLNSGYFNCMYLGVTLHSRFHVSTSATPILVGANRPASFFSA